MYRQISYDERKRHILKKKPSFLQLIVRLFSDSSPFMTFVGHIAFLVVLNLCWLVCSLPLVTAGASTAALYSVLLERQDHSYLSAVPAFFRKLRQQFKRATLLWLPFMVVGAFLLFDLWLMLQRQLMNNTVLLTPLLLSAAVWGMTLLWLYPLLASKGDLPFAAALRSAFLFALSELWRSLAALIILLVPPVLFLFYARIFVQLLPFWLLLGGSLAARLILLFFEPVLLKKG